MRFTFNASNDVFPGIAAEVKEDEREAVKMLVIVMPTTIQKKANKRPGIERGALSPYLKDINIFVIITSFQVYQLSLKSNVCDVH